MKIKTLFDVLHEIKYLKTIFNRYSDRLVRGKYTQHNSFRAMSLDVPSIKEKAEVYFDKDDAGKLKKKVLKKLNAVNFFCNRNRQSAEEFDGIYVANNYDKVREIKLFSFKESKLLAICTSEEKAIEQVRLYECLKKAYNMPSVKQSDKYDNSIEISMVELLEMNYETTALINILDSTSSNNPQKDKLNHASVKQLVSFSYDEEIDKYLNKIKGKIDSSLFDTQIPLCVQHGDLSKDNLLYGICDGKTDFWWIDWEHIDERVFFYDFFFYILHSAFYFNMKAFESYIHGDVDSILEKCFSNFDLQFNNKLKFDYFMIFAIVFLKERVCSASGLPVLIRYFNLIESMEHYAKGANIDEV